MEFPSHVLDHVLCCEHSTSSSRLHLHRNRSLAGSRNPVWFLDNGVVEKLVTWSAAGVSCRGLQVTLDLSQLKALCMKEI